MLHGPFLGFQPVGDHSPHKTLSLACELLFSQHVTDHTGWVKNLTSSSQQVRLCSNQKGSNCMICLSYSVLQHKRQAHPSCFQSVWEKNSTTDRTGFFSPHFFYYPELSISFTTQTDSCSLQTQLAQKDSLRAGEGTTEFQLNQQRSKNVSPAVAANVK